MGTDNSILGRIYGLSGPDGKIRYVGASATSLAKRLGRHRKRSASGSPYPVHAWMRSVGISSVVIVELEQCEVDVLSEREVHWITELRTHIEHGGVNVLTGRSWPDSYKSVLSSAIKEGRSTPSQRKLSSDLVRTRLASPDGIAQDKLNRAGDIGRHSRWHSSRGVVKEGCVFCSEGAVPLA